MKRTKMKKMMKKRKKRKKMKKNDYKLEKILKYFFLPLFI